MRDKLALTLKLIAPVFFLVGLLHLLLGPQADVLLGATLSIDAIHDPVLDSQNRFYGTVFTLFGAVVYLCATNLQKYRTLFGITLIIFFAGGAARIVSIAVVGAPSPAVVLLMASELLLPPLLWAWYIKTERNQP